MPTSPNTSPGRGIGSLEEITKQNPVSQMFESEIESKLEVTADVEIMNPITFFSSFSDPVLYFIHFQDPILQPFN